MAWTTRIVTHADRLAAKMKTLDDEWQTIFNLLNHKLEHHRGRKHYVEVHIRRQLTEDELNQLKKRYKDVYTVTVVRPRFGFLYCNPTAYIRLSW